MENCPAFDPVGLALLGLGLLLIAGGLGSYVARTRRRRREQRRFADMRTESRKHWTERVGRTERKRR